MSNLFNSSNYTLKDPFELRGQVQTMAYANCNTTGYAIDKVPRAILPKGNTILS